MAEINLFHKINCPDFGELKIYKFIPHDKLLAFAKLQIDVSKQYNDLIKTVINAGKVELPQLTDRDLECITLELTRIYQVQIIYINLRKSISRPEAFQRALIESSQVRALDESSDLIRKNALDTMKESMGAYEKIFEPMRLLESSIRKMVGPPSLFDEISKRMNIQDYFIDIAKGLPMVSPINEYLMKNTVSIASALEASLPSLCLSKAIEPSIKGIFDQLSIRTNAIADMFKTTQEYRDNLTLFAGSFSGILQNKDFLSDQLKLADATIYSSEKIVTKANDYFSTRWKIPEIPRKIGLPHELVEKRYKLEDNNRKSEQILEIETSTSILASDGIVYSLWKEVKELRKDIKKLEGLRSLDRRLQMLEDRTSFIEALKAFAGEMGKKYWKVFWGTIGEKFLPNPERLAQSHLGIFLNGTFYGAAFVGVEIRSGNGFIDVFVYFFGNVKIIEMKMVGLSWALSEAEDGIRQLDRYMQSENQQESYLVVFDGRKTNKGKQLKEYYDLEHGRVWVVISKIYWPSPS